MAAAAEDLVRGCVCGRCSCAEAQRGDRRANVRRLRAVAPAERPVGLAGRRTTSAVRRQQHHRALLRRRRLLVAAVAFVVVGLLAANVMADTPLIAAHPEEPHAARPAGAAAAGDVTVRRDPHIVVVPAGGSIWESVVPFAPEGTSAHAWVAQVIAANDVDPNAVPAGAVLRLPVAGSLP